MYFVTSPYSPGYEFSMLNTRDLSHMPVQAFSIQYDMHRIP